MRVLTLYDYKGGAWWHRTRQLQKHLAPSVQLDVLELYTRFDHTKYDFILLFEEYLIEAIWFVPAHKIIAGSSVSSLDSKAVDALREGRCIAAVFNSLEMYRKHEHIPNCFCCQNGVDEELFFPAASIPEDVVACWVGNSKSHYCNKGLDIIQEVCVQAGVQLLYWDQAFSPVSRSQDWLRDNVYHKASVYICASEYEGTPNPALEALACGLPVISTPVGNMPEVLNEGFNGFIIERNVNALASALRMFKRVKSQVVHKNARSSILEGWTWKHQAGKYSEMFYSLQKQRLTAADGHARMEPATFGWSAVTCLRAKSISEFFFLMKWLFVYSWIWRTARKIRYRLRGLVRKIILFIRSRNM